MAQWINDLKIAIIEENINKIRKLIDSMPAFEKLEDMKEAFALIGEAKNIVEKHKKEISREMEKIRKSKKFLESEKENFYEVFS